jgi:flagellar motor protein MotB
VGLPRQSAAVPPPVATAQFEQAQSLQPSTPPIATIFFADGSARIGRGDRGVIRRVYDDYRAQGGRIHIIGHASSRTRNLDQASHQLANFSISYERARAVAAIFERLGVPPESIIVPAGEAGNRRAEIYFEN